MNTLQIFLNDLVLLDVSTFTFTVVDTLPSSVPIPISGSSLTVIGNKCFVFGGVDNHGNCVEGLRELNISPYLDSTDIIVAEGLASDYSFKILIIGDACKYKKRIF
jgi:hypothetical protein